MQSNDPPFLNHASNGLSSPYDSSNGLSSPYSEYDYQPADYRDFSSSGPPARPAADHSDFAEPDDFYRPYAERPPSQPDIILQTSDDYDDVMATPGKRRHTNINGGTPSKPKPPFSASGTPVRTANRSASGPTTLSTAKSTPALTAAAKTRNGLIKERVKQFDASRDPSPEPTNRFGRASRTPSAQRYSNGTNHSNGQSSRIPNGHNAVLSKSKSSQSNRRPLFGEVLDDTAGADDAGFGIPRLPAEAVTLQDQLFPEDMLRDMQKYKAQEKEHGQPTHQRAHSDASTMPGAFPGDFESASPTPSPGSAPASPLRELPRDTYDSRIPVRIRGDPVKKELPLPAPSTRHRRYTPPGDSKTSSNAGLATLSARRYSPIKRVDPTHSLTAVVRAPVPKTSPTLRSTRARPPVTFNHTSSSRSKVADRHEKLLSSAGASRAKPKPSVPGSVNIAERRARLQTQLQGSSAPAGPVRSARRNMEPRDYRESSPTEPKIVVDEFERKGHVPPKEIPPPVPPLVLPVQQTSPPPEQGQFIVLDSNKTETDFEESPILGHGERRSLFPVAIPVIETQPERGWPASASHQPDSLLKQVMSIRHSSPSAVSRTELPDDFLSQADDGETIQILLGETPVLPQHNWKSPETEQNSSPEAFHTPREEEESEGDDFDGRSSIYPDDSVSMVGMRRYAELMDAEPVPPIPKDVQQVARRQFFTLNSDARSEINRVLDHYQDGHVVTPEMATGFQKQVEIMAPALAPHTAWESAEATKDYLRDLLGEAEAPTEPAVVSTSSFQTKKPLIPMPKSPYDDEEEDVGGIAIIYGPPESYNRNSSDVSADRNGTLHSHSTSNSTLRPVKVEETSSQASYFDDPVFRPEPPPKDARTEGRNIEWPVRPSLPEITTTGSGLGLSIGKPNSRSSSPPRSPHPPRPVYAPPPPPTPIKEGSLSFTQQNNSSSSLIQQQNSIAYAKRVAADIFGPPVAPAGLPESPAPRGRTERVEAVEAMETNGNQKSESNSAKPSLDLGSSLSRSQSRDERKSTSQVRPPQPIVDKIEKVVDRRRNVIKEIVDTEHSFHQDMTILTDIYMATSSAVLDDNDRRVLFGNIDQVRSFSTAFLDVLKKAASPIYTISKENRWNYKRGSFGTSNSGATENSTVATSVPLDERLLNDRKTAIGEVFLTNLAGMEQVYGDWMRGHGVANGRLIKLQKSTAVQFWLSECHASAKDITAAWDLDSLLIKPTQRMLKYPLMLKELADATPADHPGYNALVQAAEEIRAAASRINLKTKRAELVAQAMSRQVNADGKMKVGNLLNRRADKIKQPMGLSILPEDQAYNAVAQKFGGNFFQLQVVMRDIEKYTEEVTKYVISFKNFITSLTAQISQNRDWPEQESKWLRFAMAVQEIEKVLLTRHVMAVNLTVVEPINKLWRYYENPQQLMAQRKKLLPEFVRHKAMLAKSETPDKGLLLEVAIFEAVNDTLIDELPKLYDYTKKLIENCLSKFIFLSLVWNRDWMTKLASFVDEKERLEQMGLAQALASITSTYNSDVGPIKDEFANYSLCNGLALAEALSVLSPATVFSRLDDDSSYKKSSASGSKRTMSLNSEEPYAANRLSANMGASPLVGSFAMPDGVQQSGSGRIRAGSALSSRGPSTPHSINAHLGATAYGSQRPYPTSERSGELSPRGPRYSQEPISPRRPEIDQNYLFPDQSMSGATTPDERYSGIFHSALPLSDSPQQPASPNQPLDGDARIIFLAASLFEFHIDSTRKEGGYPYLTYQPGEVFDVVGTKGELWLAKNQDDSSRTIGWIWEKHFARILPEQY